MESNGECGHVVISEDTRFFLEAKFDYEFTFEEYKELYIESIDEKIISYKVHKVENKLQ